MRFVPVKSAEQQAALMLHFHDTDSMPREWSDVRRSFLHNLSNSEGQER
jgi:hypothetical protein